MIRRRTLHNAGAARRRATPTRRVPPPFGAPNKYFMFSADTHVVEPADYLNGMERSTATASRKLETRPDGSAVARSPKATGRSACAPRASRTWEQPEPGRRQRGDVQPARRGRRAAQRQWPHHRAAARRQPCRRRRRRTDVPQPRLDVLGNARSGVRRGDVPAVEPLDPRLLRPAHARRRPAHAACRPDRARRHGRRDGRDSLGDRPRFPRRLPQQLQ